MHMADALISPTVGGTMWAVSAGLLAWCARKIRQTLDDRLVPLMGVLGAFIFAAQMINFTIPATGSSGHLGGGLILAVLLGPHASFLVIASVLTIQALFFADGGLLALGCNIFNLGFFPAFVALPLIYRPIVRDAHGGAWLWIGSVLAAVISLQLGALGVVLETTMSGISELPFGKFVMLMQPIHLAIGVVEGLATAAVVAFVARARPEALVMASTPVERSISLQPVLVRLLIAAVVVGGALSWFASSHPDGLEWSMGRVSGREELDAPEAGIHENAAKLQERTAFLPDYGFKTEAPEGVEAIAEETAEAWPAVSIGTTVSGVVGGSLVMLLAGFAGYALRMRRAKA